jgi:hypothetical protein
MSEDIDQVISGNIPPFDVSATRDVMDGGRSVPDNRAKASPLGQFETIHRVFLLSLPMELFDLSPPILWERSTGAAGTVIKHRRLVREGDSPPSTSILDAMTAVATKLKLPSLLSPKGAFG